MTESKTLTPVNQNTAFRKDYKAEKAQTEDRLLKGNLRETLGKGYTDFARKLWENKDNPLYKEMHTYANKEMQKNGFDVDYTRRDIENLVRDSYRNLETGGVKEGDVSDVAGDKDREGIMLKYYDKEVNDRFKADKRNIATWSHLSDGYAWNGASCVRFP